VSTHNAIKRVVLCADDFGMSPTIDTGIIRLAEQGRISAASCLSYGPTFVSNGPALAETGAQLGLHLNFTEPLGQVGLYLPLAALIRHAYLRRLDMQAVRTQIIRQLDRFESVLGRQPDFVDGHQHVHQLPQIRRALLDLLALRYRGRAHPWLRNTRAVAASGASLPHRGKAFLIQALGAGAFSRRAIQLGFSLNARFAGVYDFQGGETAYRALLEAWLQQVGEGDLLMCHPAAQVDPADPLGRQRHAEFKVLSGDDAGRWMDQNKIQPHLPRLRNNVGLT